MASPYRRALLLIGGWLLAMVLVPIANWTAGEARMLQIVQISVVLQTLAVAATLALSWPWRRILLIFSTVALLTLLAEAIGTRTGLPFGRYVYSDRLQPQIAHVPLLIPLAWFMMLPSAWAVAVALRMRRIQFAAVSALALTSWDLFLDPQMTGWQLWVWQQPGRYFGIPLVNYIGWFSVAFLLSWLLQPLLASGWRQQTQRLLLLIFTLVWLLEAGGLAFFWGQPGPALAGLLGMGSFVWFGWRSAAAAEPRVGWQS